MAKPTIQQIFEQAVRHHQAGRLLDAEQLYREILAQIPQFPEAHCNLGNVLSDKKQFDDAIAVYRQAIAVRPSYAEAYYNLGRALGSKGQLDDAIAAYRQAVAHNPGIPEAYNNLGNALKDKGQFDEAIAAFRQAIALRPDYADAHYNLGNALAAKGQTEEAIASFRHAIALKSNDFNYHYNLGIALRDNGQLDESIAAYQKAIALNPNFPQARNNLGNALKDNGRLDEAIAAYRQAVALNPDDASLDSNLVYSLHFHPDYNAHALADELRRWNHHHAQPLRKFIQPHSNDRDPERRLRIGYVSPDFRSHVVGLNLLPLFHHHNRGQFEINCYAHVIRPDEITSQFREKADLWRNIVGLSDEQVAQQIREDRIDILVDLTLHMAKNRMLVFARKAAPVQLTYLGYCGSTGMEVVDYRLSDPHLDPPDADLSCYSEKMLRLPRTYWCYRPIATPAPSPSPAMENNFITFGCLNNFAKVSTGAIDLWAMILSSMPNSRIIIHAPAGKHRDDVLNRFELAGVTTDRILFVGTQRSSEYLQTFRRIDIALDPFPYCGGITTCDALWMGVPVVTLSGQTAVGRGGRSILSNLGLTELIAFTQDQYMQIAIDLAGDQDRMNALRRDMRARMQASPLMDAAGFARDIEAAYRQMWRTWCGR
jgi:protein O-GlcNAc transferase